MKTVALVLLSAFMVLVKLQAGQAISIRPIHTYSIVAVDKTTGEMGPPSSPIGSTSERSSPGPCLNSAA